MEAQEQAVWSTAVQEKATRETPMADQELAVKSMLC